MRALVAAACLALCLVGCESGETEMRVITFNLCGNVCGHGGNRSADFVAELADRTGADVLLLQEACRSQAARVGRTLDWHVLYATTFRGDAGGANECPGDDYGIAIVARDRLRDRREIPLPNPGLGTTQLDERVVLCASAPLTDVCTTHLVRAENDATAHDLQVKAFRALAARLADRRAVLGGDLNAHLWLARYVGTDRRRIDHVFASRHGFAAVHAVRHECTCSDHAAVVATLDL